jgi:adenine-specific DNA-methyltransferase
MQNKQTGSYYTPSILSDFLIKHIFSKYIHGTEVKILEPSCGDGQFMASLFAREVMQRFNSAEITLIDTNKNELKKAQEVAGSHNFPGVKLDCRHQDYLDFKEEGFSFVVGNPPYISKKLLSNEQIAQCEKICKDAIPTFGEVKNIWPAFLIQAINCLTENGVLCFVLPSEMLQVNYTREIRKYILNKFQRIEIFAFNELIFENIEQDVIVLIGIKEVNDQIERGVSFFQVDKLEDLKIPGYIEKHTNVHRRKLDKWTNYVLEDAELNFVEEISARLAVNTVKHFTKRVEVGIVTGNNNYFILDEAKIREWRLRPYAKPIVQRGTQIPNSLMFNKSHYKVLLNKNKKVNLICFPAKSKKRFSKSAQKYIAQGEKDKVNKSYKTKQRHEWYTVPSIWVSDGMFVKRCHLFPRVISNPAKMLVTDAMYRIQMKSEFSIRKLAFSFHNTLTFVLAELEGRFYGGGVLELTPNEFKNLQIPYSKQISNEQIKNLDSFLGVKMPIEKILEYTDSILLPGISNEERRRLSDIRIKLVNRRLKEATNVFLEEGMKIRVVPPAKCTPKELADFLQLLKKQGQVANPNLETVKSCPYLCLVYSDDIPIAIGAIKQVYKTPFDKAAVPALKHEFEHELGYIYVLGGKKYRGKGLGKKISTHLLKGIGNKPVFATTEESPKNRMRGILQELGFLREGRTYVGAQTGKTIGLYLRR